MNEKVDFLLNGFESAIIGCFSVVWSCHTYFSNKNNNFLLLHIVEQRLTVNVTVGLNSTRENKLFSFSSHAYSRVDVYSRGT